MNNKIFVTIQGVLSKMKKIKAKPFGAKLLKLHLSIVLNTTLS